MNTSLRQKIVIPDSDYEKYTVHLPVKTAFSRSRKKYLFSELEKMHPRFSSRCCVDIKYLLKNKKLFTDITIIDKLRLSEYRRRFQHRKLYVAVGTKKEAVFTTVKERVKNIFFTVTAVFLLFAFFSIKLSQNKEKMTALSSAAAGSMVAPGALGQVLPSCSDFTALFYESVKNENGSIESFEYSASGGAVEIKASLENCLPEKILQQLKKNGEAEISIPSVKYESGVPFFSVLVKAKCGKRQFPEYKRESFQEEFRSAVKKAGAELLSESFEPYSADILSSDKAVETLCRCISDVLSLCGQGLSFVSVKKNGSGQIAMHVVLSGTENPMEKIALCVSLIKKNILPLKKNPAIKKVPVQIPQNDVVGEITGSDGKKHIFLRKKSGEIFEQGGK